MVEIVKVQQIVIMLHHGELEIFNSTMAEWKWKRNNIQEVKKEADSVRFVKRNGINGGVVALSL